MNLLLDTHSFLWFVEDHPALSPYARSLIEDPANAIFLSMASIWEMAIKVSIGKLTVEQPFDVFMPTQLVLNNMTLLDISLNHVVRMTTLPFHHRDPFDRLLIGQSLVEGMPLISVDGLFDAYGVTRLWDEPPPP